MPLTSPACHSCCAAATSSPTPTRPHPHVHVHLRLFARARAQYAAGADRLPLPPRCRDALPSAWSALEGASGGWAGAGGKVLAELAGCSAEERGGCKIVNVMVSRGQLLATLVKLMLFRLAPHFRWEDVYSASSEIKRACFERAAARAGPRARFVVIGDAVEEAAAAAQLGWPFVCVEMPGASNGGGGVSGGGGGPGGGAGGGASGGGGHGSGAGPGAAAAGPPRRFVAPADAPAGLPCVGTSASPSVSPGVDESSNGGGGPVADISAVGGGGNPNGHVPAWNDCGVSVHELDARLLLRLALGR
ncbi:hypothetical protein FOA52_016287 [Chlamydomonas sp. UWO 241]|nr:hypothetical protein FOA52_016287 [Chlamydomonas sp. UWO 241]